MFDETCPLDERELRRAFYVAALRNSWMVIDTKQIGLLPVPPHTSKIVDAKVAELTPESRLLSPLAVFLREIGLHEWLTSERLHAIQQSLMSLLQDRLLNLQPHDVRSEVLQTWLGLDPSSVSSSADGESGDSVASDPRTNATASSVVEGQ